MTVLVACSPATDSVVPVHGYIPGAAATDALPARIALLGTGNVGGAVLARLQAWQDTPLGKRLVLVHVANTREAFRAAGACAGGLRLARDLQENEVRENTAGDAGVRAHPANPLLRRLTRAPLPVGGGLEIVASALGHGGTRILVDATASEDVAARHADWLARGIHVVTACKLGQGTSLSRWREIHAACAQGGAHYGDSATVGAGLPLLRTIRGLRAGGDRIHAIAGVLSGSLAWLFDRYDARHPFSGFVRDARDAGYTEPDPRVDLSGEDVRRKLLILARTAGVELDSDAVSVRSLVPPALAALPAGELAAGLPQLDAAMRGRFARAQKRGRRLHFIARLQQGRASVGLESLAADDPLAIGGGTDNRVAIWSDRYCTQPLLVQGPGAGAAVTAAALLDDVLSIQALSTPSK